MPSFQRLLVLAILGVNFFANAAVVPNGESTDLAANENDVTPDYVTQAFAKVKSTPKKTTAKAPKKTTAKATPKKTTAKATPKKTTAKTTAKKTATPKKTTAKATPTVKKTTAKATPTVKKTTAKATPTVKKTTSKAAPTVKKTTSKVAASKKTAAPKSTKAKPSVKPTSVKKTSTKPKATGKPKSSAKPKSTKATGTKVSSAKPSATSGAACALKPKAKGTKATRDELHSFAARSNLVDLGGKEGRKGKELGSSAEATVYELTEWDGKSVSDQVIKLTEDQTEAEEVGNLKACQRYTFGPSMDCKSGMFGLVMHKGQGTVLDSVPGWKSNKKELIPKIAQQTAAMAVQWMNKYGRMHTDLHPGNIMVSGSGTSLTVVDFVDLGAMLQSNGQGTKGRGAFASWTTDAAALQQTLETDYLLK